MRILMLSLVMVITLQVAEGAAQVQLFDTIKEWDLTNQPEPGELRQVPYDAGSYSFEGNPVLRNGRITVAVLNDGIHIFSVNGEGKETHRSRIVPVHAAAAPWPVRLHETQITKNEHDELLNRRDLASVTVSFDSPAGILKIQVRISRDSVLCGITPVENIESVRIFSNPRYLLMPAFVGDDLLFAPSDRGPGRIFLPSENILMELVDDGEAIVQIVWPVEGDQLVEAVVPDTPGSLRIEYVQIGLDGQPLHIACWEHPGVWHVEAVDERFTDAAGDAASVPLEWTPPFEAEWRAVYHGERSTSWELRQARDTGRIGPHGAAIYYPWPLRRVESKIELRHPPRQVQEGKADVVLIYPLQRTGRTPRHIQTPADVLRQALGDGPCDYLLAREHRPEASPGGPLCVLIGRFNVLAPIYAHDTESSEFLAILADWFFSEGNSQYRRAQDYLDFARMVTENLDAFFEKSPGLEEQFMDVKNWSTDLVRRASEIFDFLPAGKAGWSDFVPESDDVYVTMKALLDKLKSRLDAPRNPETLAEWRDLIGKLHTISLYPQSRLPLARRLTRMIQNEATRLAPLSPEAADLASRIRFEARRTLRGQHWSEYER